MLVDRHGGSNLLAVVAIFSSPFLPLGVFYSSKISVALSAAWSATLQRNM